MQSDTRPGAEEMACRHQRKGRKGKSYRLGDGSWMTCCPAHDDNSASLHLTDGEKGLIWRCFTGCDQRAVGAALGYYGERRSAHPVHQMRRQIVEKMIVPPAMPPRPVMRPEELDHPRYGIPTRIWPYHDADGRVMFYSARYETSDGKVVLPWTWDEDRGEWCNRAWPDKRPLYGLSAIIGTSLPIVYTEGEKAADAAAKLFPDWHAVTHSGGSGAIGKTDLEPLAGRVVIVMADEDEAGRRMARNLESELDLLGCDVRRMTWPTAWPDGSPYEIREGDDAADHLERGWTRAMLRETGVKLTQYADLARDFGRQEDFGFRVVVAAGEAKLIWEGRRRKPVVVGRAPADLWAKVRKGCEWHINKRLIWNDYQPGRLPRRDGEVWMPECYGAEVFGLLTAIASGTPAGAALAAWEKQTPYYRRKIWVTRRRSPEPIRSDERHIG